MTDKKLPKTTTKGPTVTHGPPVSFDEICAIFERCEAQGATVHVSQSLKSSKGKPAK